MIRNYRRLTLALFVLLLLAIALPVLADAMKEDFDWYGVGKPASSITNPGAAFIGSGWYVADGNPDFALTTDNVLRDQSCSGPVHVRLVDKANSVDLTYAYPDKTKGMFISAWMGVPGQGGTQVAIQVFYGNTYNYGLNWYEGYASMTTAQPFNYLIIGSHGSCSAFDHLIVQ